jgi:hypothetical protein
MRVSISDVAGNGRLQISSDIDQVVAELAVRFPAVPSEVLRRVVAEEFDAFDGAAISTFVPVLVSKAARVRLTRNVTPAMGERSNPVNKMSSADAVNLVGVHGEIPPA